MNCLSIASDDAADVTLAELDLKDRCFAAWNFREHDVIRKFHQLANNKFEKLSHAEVQTNHEPAFAQGYGVAGKHESTRIFARRARLRALRL